MVRLDLDTIWPRLVSAADEMATTLFRTAFSHDVVEVHDMSTGLYDDRGNLIGQTWLGATGHVGVMPVIGFSVTSVHHVDIGGRKGSGLSEEVFEEGLVIPLMHLHRAGAPNEDLFAILTRNVRFSEKVMGDIRAQVAAGWVGAEALVRIARDHGLDDLRSVADDIITRSEQSMRAGIA